MAQKPNSKTDESQIYDNIHQAIAERRLEPGVKLAEEALADVFGVSRARIRRVLLLLAKENVVKLEPNRGAFVRRPTVEEAKNVLAARRVIELYLVREAATRATKSDIAELRKIVDAEVMALKNENHDQTMRLSGEFHMAVADAAGNPIMAEFLGSLISRCYLILATYQRRDSQSCPQSDHGGIVDLIEKGDPDAASAAQEKHFEHILEELDLRNTPTQKTDLRNVFGRGQPALTG